MKDEISTVLNYLECEGEMLRLRDHILSLNAFQSAELQKDIDDLIDIIKQTNILSHKYTGFYYLFLGCAYFEQRQYQDAVRSLKSSVFEIWGSQVNKALACWLLGLCYSDMQDFPKARNELEGAFQLLVSQRGVSSPRTEREYRSRRTIQENIKHAYDRLFNESLFRTVRPDPSQSTNHFHLQDPPMGENDTFPVSLNMPISVTNENNPAINIPITNENHPVNKLSFNPPAPDAPAKIVKVKKEEHETREKNYETRTDDDDGYLVIQSIPVYDEYAQAGQTDGPEPSINRSQFAEFHQVSIGGKTYAIHSLRSNSKQVNVNKDGSWSWIKVKGESMNAMKGNVSINDGDYILFQGTPNANDNDIVIATRKDAATHDSSAHVKRLRKSRTMLYSETTETGTEYDPIDMKKENIEIVGIIYAVAKPA